MLFVLLLQGVLMVKLLSLFL